MLLLALMLILLGSALAGASRLFGYALVAFLGLMCGLGFARRRDPLTWIPPVIATAVLLVAFTGMFANESAAVHGAGDTTLGFQRGTAFLIYGVWIPAFFTMAVSFALIFDRVNAGHSGHADTERGRQ